MYKVYGISMYTKNNNNSELRSDHLEKKNIVIENNLKLMNLQEMKSEILLNKKHNAWKYLTTSIFRGKNKYGMKCGEKKVEPVKNIIIYENDSIEISKRKITF